jgi:hypothetical protein
MLHTVSIEVSIEKIKARTGHMAVRFKTRRSGAAYKDVSVNEPQSGTAVESSGYFPVDRVINTVDLDHMQPSRMQYSFSSGPD